MSENNPEQPVFMDFDYRSWILEQKDDEYTTVQDNENHIRLVTEYGQAEIHFTDIEPGMTVVEFKITAKKDDSVKFYLHFQVADEEHVRQLYYEMAESLKALKNERTTRILLSCSAGFTTSFFAEQLNTTAGMAALDYEFSAVPYMEIYEAADQYDAILIAPQIGYMLKRLKESMPEKPIFQIPAAVFARYDAMACIEFVMNGMKEFYAAKAQEEKPEPRCACEIEEEARILSVAVMQNTAQVRVYYRMYEAGEIIFDRLMIRDRWRISDLDDVLDVVMAEYEKPDMIGITMPGVVSGSHISLPEAGIDDYPVGDHIRERYGIETIVTNNANAAAVGYHGEHPEYRNICFHSQPFGYAMGGQGNIVDGRLVLGKNSAAGEVKYFLHRMQFSDDLEKLAWREDGMLEVVSKALLPTIALMAPEMVVLRSPMTPDMEEVKRRLSSWIPEEYMPEFTYVYDASGYMLDGQMIICAEKMSENERLQAQK